MGKKIQQGEPIEIMVWQKAVHTLAGDKTVTHLDLMRIYGVGFTVAVGFIETFREHEKEIREMLRRKEKNLKHMGETE